MTNQQIYGRAADYLETYGWNQGCYATSRDEMNLQNPPLCLAGALSMAATGHWIPPHSLRGLFEDFGTYLVGANYCDGEIIHWNDKPGRTQDEVVEMLRKASISGNVLRQTA